MRGATERELAERELALTMRAIEAGLELVPQRRAEPRVWSLWSRPVGPVSVEIVEGGDEWWGYELHDLRHDGTVVAWADDLEVVEALVNAPRSEWAELLYEMGRLNYV